MKKISLDSDENSVVTTAQIAFTLETTEDEVLSTFSKHRSRFKEGQDYFVLQSGELLWTHQGFLLFVFAIDTDAAWKLYEELFEVVLARR